ncbi:MAG: hypothetical protein ACKVQU_19915 [Burkholderiales bacterium]
MKTSCALHSTDPSELYLALQQDVVDGFEYPLPDLVAQRMYEVAKFLSLDRHATDFFILTANLKLWSSLPANEQGWITAAMKTAMDWPWKPNRPRSRRRSRSYAP